MGRHFIFSLILFFSFQNASIAQIKILFDATKAETAANADWTIDADKYNVGFGTGVATIGGSGTEANPQRYPSPAQSGITAATPENYWSGALSSWGIECVKKGYSVETLPIGGKITFGDGSNPQDLSQYRVAVFCEPNISFTAAEKTAVIKFVENGGGLLMIADHDMSDRNFDGIDSPSIFNDLMSNNGVKINPFGLAFNLDDISQTSSNIINAGNNPIINGPYGTVNKIKTSGGCSMTTNSVANPTVQGLIFKNNTQKLSNEVLAVMSQYSKGKVFAIGDSSLPDDGSGDPNDNLYAGWLGDADGNHRKLLMNATVWLATAKLDSIKASVKKLQNCICSDSGNGTIELEVSGGDNNFKFLWSNGATTNPAVLLTPGVYQVTITSSGVPPLVIKSLVVTAPNPLLVNVDSPKVLTCSNNSVGLYASASGGSTPYFYKWSSGTPTISMPGNYSLTVTDKNGCVTTASASVVQNITPPNVQVQSGQITCSNPKAVLSASSVNQNVIYEWKGPQNFLSTKKDTAVSVAGWYSLMATDTLNGCSTEKKVSILENNGNAALTVKLIAKRDASDIPNGLISLEANNGTPPYRYQWKDEQGNTIGSNTAMLSDIDKGTYTCEITDALGCSVSLTVSIRKVLTSTEAETGNHVRLYPNPAADYITIETAEIVPCAIIDVNGRKVMDGFSCQKWDIKDLPAGRYLLNPAKDPTGGCIFLKF